MREDAPSQPWGQSLQDLAAALPGLLTDRLELLALELNRAGRGVARIMLLVLLAAILGVTAWLALCGGIALTLVALGLSWPLATAAVMVINLLLAWAVLARIGRLVTTLGLPATRRHLAFFVEVKPVVGAHVASQSLGIPPESRT